MLESFKAMYAAFIEVTIGLRHLFRYLFNFDLLVLSVLHLGQLSQALPHRQLKATV